MIRCMSSSKVFVGVIMDRETGRSRDFGFVTFADAEAASAAIQAMDQSELHGRTVRVNYANDRPQGGWWRWWRFPWWLWWRWWWLQWRCWLWWRW
ncbi:putative RNA recognition motif domain, nucleotide-binding alpha-beta plait domain superfamily [Helianthus anomalus]